jgi:CDP-diglyceride synthetase
MNPIATQAGWAVAGMILAGSVLQSVQLAISHATIGSRREAWLKFAVFCLVMLTASLLLLVTKLLMALLLFLLTIELAAEFTSAVTGLPQRRRVIGSVSLCLFGALLSHMVLFDAAIVVPILLVVASTDAFGQLIGRLVKGPKLCPQLSPNKTLSGLIGGFAAALSIGWVMTPSAVRNSAIRWLLIVAVAALFGVLGDLLFSAIKRTRNIKDFGDRLPGHGGWLDRFDSLLIGLPVGCWLYLLIL